MHRQLLGIAVPDRGLCDTGRLDVLDLDLEGARQTGDDLVLQLQEVGALGIELIGPDMGAGRGVDELRVDPHVGPVMLLAALERVADAKVVMELLYVDILAFVCECGAAGDDEAVG